MNAQQLPSLAALFLIAAVALLGCLAPSTQSPYATPSPTPTAIQTPTPTPNEMQGTLAGTYSFGPICPVERIPPDPNCQPKYDGQMLQVYDETNTTLAAEITLNENGAFSISLPQGTYYLFKKDIGITPNTRPPIMPRGNLPIGIEIQARQTTQIEISVDTGIR